MIAALLAASSSQYSNAEPPEKSAPEVKQAGEAKSEIKSEDSPAATDQKSLVAYHGRVVDEEGKPIAGAELWYALPTSLSTPLGEILGSGSIRKVATTDSDGAFAFSVPPPVWAGHKFYLNSMRLTATAAGYGCDFMPLVAFETKPIASDDRKEIQSQTDDNLGEGRFAGRTLILHQEAGPIRGRLLDLEGRPLADVEVCIESVQNVKMNQLKKAFETSSPELAQQALRPSRSAGWLSSPDWEVLYPRRKTDENGEFTMSGLGRNQIATVRLYHERADADILHIVGIEMEPQQLPRSSLRGNQRKETYYGTKFTHAVGPAILVSGVVTESQSGKPVANAQVYVERLFRRDQAQLRFARHIKTATDDQGRYKLVGIPPGKEHVLQVIPKTAEPLFPIQQEISLNFGQVNETVNLQIPRGIWIEGKITDAQTGEPISGSVDYFPFRNNPDASSLTGIGGFAGMYRFTSDRSGNYQVPGLRGPGVVMVHATSSEKVYPKAAGADKIEGYEPKNGRLTAVMVGVPLSNWNQVSFVNPPADAESFQFNITLSAGLILKGHIVNPDGSAATEVEVLGQVPKEPFFVKLKGNTFDVINYAPEVPRDLFFTAMKNSLVAYLHLEGDAPQELTAQLQPAVTVRGRLVNTETDEPATGYQLHCNSSKLGNFRIAETQTDQHGRFDLKGLLAGNVYRMDASNRNGLVNRKNGFTINLENAKPGDEIELGDVTGSNAKKE